MTIDLLGGHRRWLVAGPPRSGRTTVLTTVLTQLHAAGVRTVVAASRRSALTELAASLGLEPISPESTTPIALQGLAVVLIDDCEAFAAGPIEAELAALADRSDGAGPAVVASARSDDAATSYRGIVAAVRRSHTGILLRPSAVDGDLLGVRLPRVRPATTPGRGVLVADQPHLQRILHGRAALPVQIAL